MDDRIDTIEAMHLLSKVKRGAVSRDVIALCEITERLLLAKPSQAPTPEHVRLRFDKKAYQKIYMKVYMAKRRAEARRPKGEVK